MTPHGKAHHIVHCWNSPASYEEGYSTAADTGLTRTIPSAREDSLTRCIVSQNGSLSRTRDGSDLHSFRALRVRNHTMMLRSNASISIDIAASRSRASSGSSFSSLVAFMLLRMRGGGGQFRCTEHCRGESIRLGKSNERSCRALQFFAASPYSAEPAKGCGRSRRQSNLHPSPDALCARRPITSLVSKSRRFVSSRPFLMPGCLQDESRAKATKGKAGMAVGQAHVRRSTAGTGLRVGVSGAGLTATSEFMEVTAGETAPNSEAARTRLKATSRRPRPSWRCLQKSRGVTADATEWRTAC